MVDHFEIYKKSYDNWEALIVTFYKLWQYKKISVVLLSKKKTQHFILWLGISGIQFTTELVLNHDKKGKNKRKVEEAELFPMAMVRKTISLNK